jgi:hypothetical protein
VVVGDRDTGSSLRAHVYVVALPMRPLELLLLVRNLLALATLDSTPPQDSRRPGTRPSLVPARPGSPGSRALATSAISPAFD